MSSSIKSSILSNIIKGHTKSTLSMRQVEDHVCPGLTRRIPTICVLLSSLFQERVSNFAINVLLLQNATITEQNMGVNILESGGLAKAEEMIMYKAVLNSVKFLNVIYNSLHVLATKFRTKASVPIGTPIPTKPSGQKEARRTSPLR